MTAKIFWQQVFKTEQDLREEIAGRVRRYREGDANALGGQPDHGQSVFIESVENLNARTTAGHVCEVRFPLAAQRVVEMTHKLASAEKITRYHEQRAENRRLIDEMNEKASSVRRVVALRGDNE